MSCKYILLLAILHWGLIAGNGQNLVPNPGFEDISRCPDHSGQLTNAVSWINPNLKSPDLYHTCVGANCDNPPFVCVPDNWVGQQYPFAGHAYAGIFVGGGNENREYLQVPLLSPLVAGQAYELVYHLSLAEGYEHGIDRMGAYFSSTPVVGDTQLDFIPQSTTPPGLYLTEKNGWMTVTDTIIAEGNEAFLTIGNFSNEADTRYMDGLGGDRASAYYYLDEVQLRVVSPISPEAEDPAVVPKPGSGEDASEETAGTTDCRLFIPNAFSPNGDGINDTFTVFHDCSFESYELMIFNRWGRQVFLTRQPDQSWSGAEDRGRPLPEGVYLYYLRYSVDGIKRTKAGEFTILR